MALFAFTHLLHKTTQELVDIQLIQIPLLVIVIKQLLLLRMFFQLLLLPPLRSIPIRYGTKSMEKSNIY